MSAKRFPVFDINLTSFSPEQRVQLQSLLRQLVVLREQELLPKIYTNASRPAAGIMGKIIFNSDDGQLNIDDGTNWTLPDGTTT